MSKILYILDNNKNNEYEYDISEDTIIYHFSINCSCNVKLNLVKKDISLYYYYNNINYDDNEFRISVIHSKSNTHSELFNHGVNVGNNKLNYDVEGIVPKKSSGCVCNQENQIINMNDGKSIILPKLLIDNYDVDSNHGAYIGKFSKEKLFYLMSRGLSLKEANKLLLNGFLINMDSVDSSEIKLFIDEIEKI
ncbi:MAG: SufD family Fe-S cluster assembly protein [Bacilli bacterium]|nr:SufD family Fe-S cluster assembly protein [Bacilli bacterium]